MRSRCRERNVERSRCKAYKRKRQEKFSVHIIHRTNDSNQTNEQTDTSGMGDRGQGTEDRAEQQTDGVSSPSFVLCSSAPTSKFITSSSLFFLLSASSSLSRHPATIANHQSPTMPTGSLKHERQSSNIHFISLHRPRNSNLRTVRFEPGENEVTKVKTRVYAEQNPAYHGLRPLPSFSQIGSE